MMSKTLIIRQNKKRITIRGYGGGGGGGSGWIKITNASPNSGGSVSDKIFQDSGNTILQSFTTSDGEVDISISSSYPLVIVNNTESTLSLSTDGGHYSGNVPLSFSENTTIKAILKTPDGNSGAFDTVESTIDLPPNIISAIFTGGYPGIQTELKQGDTFDLQVTANKSFDRIVLTDSGISSGQNIDVTPGLSATVSVTIADRGNVAQQLAANIQVRDTLTGALSSDYSTDSTGSTDGINVLTLNNLYPTVNWGASTYPGVQQALKNSETTSTAITLSDLDSVLFDSNGTGQLDITNSTTIETPKIVTRLAGDYNISSANLRCVANRTANDASTTQSTIVQIANVAPTINVSVPYSRLRSGGNNGTSPQDYSVSIISNQNLLNTPSMSTDSGGNRGTFQGAGFIGGPTTWNRTIRIDETVSDEKGVFTFESLIATGLAGVIQNVINSGSSYELGGFVSRDVTFQAFQTISDSAGVEISDFSKIQAGLWEATNQQSIRYPTGTAPPQTNGYTSQQAVGSNPHNVEWLDTDAASTSSGVSRLFNYEEIV